MYKHKEQVSSSLAVMPFERSIADEKPLVTIYPSYDVLFLGYIEYGFQILSRSGEIRLRFESCKNAPVTYSPRERGFRGQMLFSVRHGAKDNIGLFDVSDGYNDLRTPLLHEIDVYYKMNYCPEYIAQVRKEIGPSRGTFAPATASFPVKYLDYLGFGRYLVNSWRRTVGFDENSNLRDDYLRWKVLVGRYRRLLRERLSAKKLLEMRRTPETGFDVYYSAACWTEDMELVRQRVELIRALRSLRGYKVRAEFVFNTKTAEMFPDLVAPYRRSVAEYYQTLAETRLAIIHKSLSGGAISWRLGESMALGKAYIHERTPNSLYMPHVLDPEYGVFDDADSLLSKIQAVLSSEELRQQMKARSAALFDAYFAPDAAARYLIHGLLRRGHENRGAQE